MSRDLGPRASGGLDRRAPLRLECPPGQHQAHPTEHERREPLLEPQAIFRENVKDVVAAGYVTKQELCTGKFAKLCRDYGVV